MGDQEFSEVEILERTNEKKFDEEYAQAKYTPPKRRKIRTLKQQEQEARNERN